MHALTELAAVLPGSRIRTIDGRNRVILDILAGESLDIYQQPDRPDWFVLEGVYMTCDGQVGRKIIAIVLGGLLVPGMAATYTAMRKEQVKAND